ncbi:MAG: hypothetical protein KF805_05810 [Phycisphaeraceae bacterium]|nr:hypothetical protein [Phycisphaeraceae bacterium]
MNLASIRKSGLLCVTLASGAILLVGCATGSGSGGSGDGLGAGGGGFGNDSSGWGESGAEVGIANESGATLKIEPYVSNEAGELLFPLPDFFIVMPGQSATRFVGLSRQTQDEAIEGARYVAVTVTAISGREGFYGTWIATNQGGGYNLQARDGSDGYVHLYYEGSNQEVGGN